MTDIKTCPQCGREFARPTGTGEAQWHNRRYCSNQCSGASKQRAFRGRQMGIIAAPSDALCDCGQPSTVTIRFTQLNAYGHPFLGWLRVCDDCRQLFEEEEHHANR